MTDGAGRWALVAGGSGGIGGAIARELAGAGWNVAVTYHGNREGAMRTAAEVERAGQSAQVLATDLRDADRTASLLDELATSRPLQGVVYAAGPRTPQGYMTGFAAEEFGRVIDADVKACFNLLGPAARQLRRYSGAVVALSTQAVARYARRNSLSSVPKSAVEAIVKAVAVEEGRYGVRANAIGVGMIVGEGMWESMHASGQFTPEVTDAALAATPMRRFGAPEDVARAVRFLLSDDAGWITGQTLNVDGGYSI